MITYYKKWTHSNLIKSLLLDLYVFFQFFNYINTTAMNIFKHIAFFSLWLFLWSNISEIRLLGEKIKPCYRWKKKISGELFLLFHSICFLET